MKKTPQQMLESVSAQFTESHYRDDSGFRPDHNQEEFAFGNNDFLGSSCPAVTAGYRPGVDDGAELTLMAEEYDAAMERLTAELGRTMSRGVAAERLARTAWFLAIEELESPNHPNPISPDAAEWGRTIADLLDWDDPFEEDEFDAE